MKRFRPILSIPVVYRNLFHPLKASTVTISTYDIDVGEEADIFITIAPADATGTVECIINNEQYFKQTQLDSNVFVFNVPDLTAGTKNVVVNYLGDSQYTSCNNTASFTVSKLEPFLIVNCQNVTWPDNESITCLVPSNATGSVTIVIEGNSYTSGVSNGTASFTVSGLTPGTKTVSASYSGDLRYVGTTDTSTFIVSKTSFSDEDVRIIDLGDNRIGVIMPEGVTGTVNLKYQDSTQTSTLNSESYCEFDVTNLLSPGPRLVTIEYLGDQYYSPHTTNATIEVPKYYTEMTVEAQDTNVGDDIPITITLPAGATGTVTLEIDGKTYGVIVNSSGTTTTTIPGVLAGNKTIVASYSGDDYYMSQYTTANVVVSKSQSTFTVRISSAKEGRDFSITYTLSSDATGTITTTINENIYTGSIVNGRLRIVISGLAAGTYQVTSLYSGDDKYESMESIDTLEVIPNSSPIS